MLVDLSPLPMSELISLKRLTIYSSQERVDESLLPVQFGLQQKFRFGLRTVADKVLRVKHFDAGHDALTDGHQCRLTSIVHTLKKKKQMELEQVVLWWRMLNLLIRFINALQEIQYLCYLIIRTLTQPILIVRCYQHLQQVCMRCSVKI